MQRKAILFPAVIFTFLLLIIVSPSKAGEQKTMLFHLKTSLKHDDAQICVAYNEIWASILEGFKVKVLIDADAVNTYKVGWKGKDKIEKYKLPQNLKKELANQFNLPVDKIPSTYGEYLQLLNEEGADFYINGAMLVVAGIENKFGSVKNISAKFFKPVNLKEMINLRANADIYMVY